jgi:hypothetical protein
MVTVVIDGRTVVHRSQTMQFGAKVPKRWQRGHRPLLRVFVRVTPLAARVTRVFRVFTVHSLSGQRRSGEGW